MKSTLSTAPWFRAAIAAVLVLIGVALVWIVLLGPAALTLLSPR